MRPELVAEVRFAGWTPDGHVRHAVFVALRSDKPARSVTRERVVTQAALAVLPGARLAKLKVTHGERVVDAATGLTKRHAGGLAQDTGHRTEGMAVG